MPQFYPNQQQGMGAAPRMQFISPQAPGGGQDFMKLVMGAFLRKLLQQRNPGMPSTYGMYPPGTGQQIMGPSPDMPSMLQSYAPQTGTDWVTVLSKLFGG